MNLFNFLVQIGEHDSMWIDALCINQFDLDERGAQVRIMGDIYRYTSRVLVWLGLGIDQTLTETLACSSFKRFSGVPTASHVMAKLAIGTNAYWGRVWTVPEFLLAKEIVLIYGRDHFSLSVLKKILGEFWGSHSPTAGLRAIQTLLQHREGHEENDLRSLFHLSLSRQCKEPHDRVYSLLQVALDRARLRIRVDYEQDMDDLFAAVMLSVTLKPEQTLNFAKSLAKGLGLGSQHLQRAHNLANGSDLAVDPFPRFKDQFQTLPQCYGIVDHAMRLPLLDPETVREASVSADFKLSHAVKDQVLRGFGESEPYATVITFDNFKKDIQRGLSDLRLRGLQNRFHVFQRIRCRLFPELLPASTCSEACFSVGYFQPYYVRDTSRERAAVLIAFGSLARGDLIYRYEASSAWFSGSLKETQS